MLAFILSMALTATASEPARDDLAQRDLWTAAHLQPLATVAGPVAGAGGSLTVVAKFCPVAVDQLVGKPLRAGERDFTAGVFCHAPNRLRVRLVKPGKRFTALVAIDSNPQTRPGHGSVVCTVVAGGTTLYTSPLVREGMTPVAIEVELGGATEFDLVVGDGGDGVAADQADWLEPVVTLADGTTLPINRLPLTDISSREPFSFTYDGKPSTALLATWTRSEQEERIDNVRTRHRSIWSDPVTSLEVACESVVYADFPVAEWTLHFTNRGTAPTPRLSLIDAIDASFTCAPDHDFTLHWFNGSDYKASDFEPHHVPLAANAKAAFAPGTGRASDTTMPYFNLDWGQGGMIAAIGWPGHWSAEFARDADRSTRFHGGMDGIDCALQPGESIRSPLIALMFWHGDWIDGQNHWRRWMTTHNQPHPGGKPVPPLSYTCGYEFDANLDSSQEAQLAGIKGYADKGLLTSYDFWWVDAGWYTRQGDWTNVGTWTVDTKKYPDGIKAVSDEAHRQGRRFVLWFEPERVTPGSWLYQNHPDWLLGADGQWKLLDLGNPEAWKWTVETIDRLLIEQGVDLYRQDFNMDPLPCWATHDSDGRRGITQIQHITGYLAFWDELRRRHPDMLIDTCASGGRRLDIETLRRSVPLLRSDYQFEPLGQQGQTYGLSFLIPYYGSGQWSGDPYMMRSSYTPSFGTGIKSPDDNAQGLIHAMAEWRSIAEDMLGDYYPLTDYGIDSQHWMAWQFNSPETGRGVVMAFRQPNSGDSTKVVHLRGLDQTATYEITDVDRQLTSKHRGQELMEQGLTIVLDKAPSSWLLRYRSSKP